MTVLVLLHEIGHDTLISQAYCLHRQEHRNDFLKY